MTVIQTATLELLGESAQFRRDMAGAQRAFAGVGASFQQIGARMRRQFLTITDSAISFRGVMVGLAGAAGLAVVSKRMFDLGAAVEETGSKFRTVLGPEVQRSQQFLDSFATTAGLTVREGRDLFATVAAIGQGFGQTQKASADLATEVVKLAGDLSSFNNVPIEETSRAIIGGLTGERESLKRLGIVLHESQVQKRALANTGKRHVEALTQEEKALAALALIAEQAGVAVGDLGRTKDSAANRARALRAEFLNLRDSLATALQPAFAVVLDEIGRLTGTEGIKGLGDELIANGDRIAAWTKFAIESFKTVGLSIVALPRLAFNAGQLIGRALDIAASLAAGAFADMLNRVQGLVNLTIEGLNKLPGIDIGFRFDTFERNPFFENARSQAASFVGDLKTMEQVIDGVAGGYADMWRASEVAWRTARNQIKEATDQITPPRPPGPDTGQGRGGASLPRRLPQDQMGAVLARGLPEMKIPTPQEWLQRFGPQVQETFQEATDAVRLFQDSLASVADMGLDAIADFATGSKNAIRDFVSDALQQLTRLAVKIAALNILRLLPQTSLVASVTSALAGRAHGGPVSANHPYIVGERGPELFVPSGTGNIVPNHALAGGGGLSASDLARIFDFSKMPAAQNPLAAARDTEWQRFFRESTLAAEEAGFRGRR